MSAFEAVKSASVCLSGSSFEPPVWGNVGEHKIQLRVTAVDTSSVESLSEVSLDDMMDPEFASRLTEFACWGE